MQQTFVIEGMHCSGCVSRVTAALKRISDDVEVTLDPPKAIIDASEPVSVDDVQAAVSKAGDYRVTPVSRA
jgi:copper chaperone